MNAIARTPLPEPSAIRLLPDPGSGGAPAPGLLHHLSASRLKCWQTCRRQFHYRYVERVAVPTAPALLELIRK